MNDLFLAATVPIIIVLLAAIYSVWTAWLNHKQEIAHECDHDFDRWDKPYETPHAYVQQRTCTKCGLTQTIQQQKFIA